MHASREREPRPPATLELSLEPAARNAAVARRAIEDLVERSGLADAAGAARVIVTEAFTNAAEHSGPGGGHDPITVSARALEDGLEISVRDRGEGFRPRPLEGGQRGRLGLAMIAAVADCVRIAKLPGGGTELRARICAGPAP